MKIIFQVDGGIGKSVMATAVCKAIKTQYPKSKLIVITGYPEVFLCNPNVDRVYNHNGLSYFYEENIEDQDVKMMVHNPYLESDFVMQRGHVIKVWCEMFGIKYNGELPELFINSREQSFFVNQFGKFEKPIFLIQTSGGAPNQPNKYSWTRDIPIGIAQQIVNHFAKDYHVLHIRRDDQLALQNTTQVKADFRAIAVLILMSSKRLFIDSFAQHTAAALGKPSVVTWIGNIPGQFGYDLHTNIVAHPPTIKPELRHSVFSKYDISGQPIGFPYNSEYEIFNAKDIVAALNEEITEKEGAEYTATNNLIINEKLRTEINNGSRVAKRLSNLAGKIDLTGVKQVLDIGSWHLMQSIEFSNVFKKARIDAFEPVPESYELCIANHSRIEDQKKKRINVHNLALSEKKGNRPFFAVDTSIPQKIDAGFSSIFKFNDGLKNSYYGESLVQKEIKVKSDTLDNWCAENKVNEVDILWIDVQGAELLVFQGAENTLKNTRIIMSEVGLKPYYEGHTLKPDIDKFLFERGFRELEGAFELNGFDYEANTIYVRN